MSEFQQRFGQWHYIGTGTLADAKHAARATGLRRFTFGNSEWYWYRREWRHD